MLYCAFVVTLWTCYGALQIGVLLLLLAHSKNELMQWRGVRRLSVCLSVCKLLRNRAVRRRKSRGSPAETCSPQGGGPTCRQSRRLAVWQLLEDLPLQNLALHSPSRTPMITLTFDPSTSTAQSMKLLRKSLLLADKWPDRHQTYTWWTPGQRTSRVCTRSRS